MGDRPSTEQRIEDMKDACMDIRCDHCDCRIDVEIDTHYFVKCYHPLVEADITRIFCGPECIVGSVQ